MNGTFNPIHYNHLSIFYDVKNYLKEKYHILIGFITIRPDISTKIKFKNSPNEFLPAIHRVAMAQEMVKEIDWIDVDTCQGFQNRQITFKELKEHFETVVGKVKMFFLCGLDILREKYL